MSTPSPHEFPPDDWEEDTNADWGTNVYDQTSIVNSGNWAIEFDSTADASVYLATERNAWKQVIPGETYRAMAWMRADNVTAKNCLFEVQWKDKDDAVVSTTTILSGVLPAINTWYLISDVIDAPATAAWAKLRIGRTTASFHLYVDYCDLLPFHPAFWAYLDANTDYNNGDTIVFDVDDGTGDTYNLGGCYNNATGVFTAPSADLYSFVSMVIFDPNDLGAGDVALAYFWKNNASILANGTKAIGDYEGDRSLVVSGPIYLDRGDTIEVGFLETAAGAVTVYGDIAGAPMAYFGGARL